MKKLKNFIRFLLIFGTTSVIFALVGQIVFKYIWGFALFNLKSYKYLYDFWENGGVFNKFKDITLVLGLVFLPIYCINVSFKIYKKGFLKVLSIPFTVIYRALTRPKSLEVEHVSIKNIGIKDKTLDEIISTRIKEKGQETTVSHASKNIREQISAKIEENNK